MAEYQISHYNNNNITAYRHTHRLRIVKKAKYFQAHHGGYDYHAAGITTLCPGILPADCFQS